MNIRFKRSTLLIDENILDEVSKAKIAIFGLGGVGSYAFEMLVRCGITNFYLIDGDTFDITNLNRQLLATEDTIDKNKVDVAKQRAISINPEVDIKTYNLFYLKETKNQIPFSEFDFVLDCIDTVSAKIDIIEECYNRHIDIISAMGCGNRLNADKLVIKDIYQTNNDPLSKVIRRELRKRKISSLKVVTSEEISIKPLINLETKDRRKAVPGSLPFVPSTAGILMANECFKTLVNKKHL